MIWTWSGLETQLMIGAWSGLDTQLMIWVWSGLETHLMIWVWSSLETQLMIWHWSSLETQLMIWQWSGLETQLMIWAWSLVHAYVATVATLAGENLLTYVIASYLWWGLSYTYTLDDDKSWCVYAIRSSVLLTQAHPTLINHLTSTRASTIVHCIPIYESRLWFLVPKPSLFFVLQFVFSITYRARTHITWMTSGKPVVNVSMCGHIQTTTRRDPDNREINSTGKKLALGFVAYKFEFGHHPSLYPPHVHITW